MAVRIRPMTDRGPRNLVAGMVTDTAFLAELVPHWGDGMFPAKAHNVIGGWCVKYYREHNEAPGHAVQVLFDQWADTHDDETDVNAVTALLNYANDTYKPVRTELLVSQADTYFNTHRLQATLDELAELVEADKAPEAWGMVADMQRVDLGGRSWASLGDADAMLAAYEYGQLDNIIQWPKGTADDPHPLNPLNNFFEGQLLPESFVSILAGEKVGKSWWLSELAEQAGRCGLRTVHMSVGDMTDRQWRRRSIPRITGRPLKQKTVRRPSYFGPGGVLDDPDNITFEERDLQPATKAEFIAAQEKWRASPMAKNIRVVNRPMSTVSAEMVRTTLTGFANDGWHPEVLVIDYADILIATNNKEDSRYQIDKTWRELRRISSELGTLVITATQADSQSYEQTTLTKANFSEAKQKLAHVTCMFGINQTPDEKELGVVRLNHIVARDSDVTTSCHVAGCLSLGRPAIRATF